MSGVSAMSRLAACAQHGQMILHGNLHQKQQLEAVASERELGWLGGRGMGVREGQTWTVMAQGSQGRWVEAVRQGCHHAKSAPSVKPHVMASTCVSPSLIQSIHVAHECNV